MELLLVQGIYEGGSVEEMGKRRGQGAGSVSWCYNYGF